MGWARIGLIAVGAMFLVGCQNKLYDDNKRLVDENKALREQNDSMRLQQQQPQVAQQPAPQPPPQPPQQPVASAPPENKQAAAAPGTPEDFGGLETTVNKVAGTTTVHLPSDIFFDPGQARIKTSAVASLDKVVAALKKKFASKTVIVEGHTDSTPIRVSKWSSNQELSEARAKAVAKYLVDHGISPGRVATKGFGDSRPRGNENSRNRRVEIVVNTVQ